MTTPKPKVVQEVCSLCGLDWKTHDKNPTAETCVKLLLDEVSSLNARLAHRPLVQPISYPVPYPVYPRPFYPHWYTSYSQLSNSGGTVSLNAPAPRAISATSSAR